MVDDSKPGKGSSYKKVENSAGPGSGSGFNFEESDGSSKLVSKG